MSAPARVQGPLAPDAPVAFDAPARARLAELADALMPADGGMPSVLDADVAGARLDEALAARPDYALLLADALRVVHGAPAPEAIARLRGEHPLLWEAVTTVLPAAYLMSPEVLRALGYAGQTAEPIDLNLAPDYEGLIDDVLRRGPLYRPTPDR